jgi:hypothetical protein
VDVDARSATHVVAAACCGQSVGGQWLLAAGILWQRWSWADPLLCLGKAQVVW